MTGTINLNAASGAGTWTKIHVNAGATFAFIVTAAHTSINDTFTINASAPFTIGGQAYQVTEDYRITRQTSGGPFNELNGTQLFVGPCGQVIYTVHMSR